MNKLRALSATSFILAMFVSMIAVVVSSTHYHKADKYEFLLILALYVSGIVFSIASVIAKRVEIENEVNRKIIEERDRKVAKQLGLSWPDD